MTEDKWWPSVDEYNPNISEEKWMELLQDREIFSEKSMCFMRRMLDIGGTATCADLSKKYGETAQGYVGIEQGVAGRIIKRLNLKKCPGDGNEYLFPVMFLGRAVNKNTDKNEGTYIWKLRPELHTALQKINLKEFELYAKGENKMDKSVNKYIEILRENKNIILHGAPGTGKTHLAKQIAKAMNNSEQDLSVFGFETFISEPGYLAKHDSAKDKETGTIQRYVQVAAKLLEKYKSFEYIANNAESLRNQMQDARDMNGKPGWDNNQIVVNHIKKYVDFARNKNYVNSDDTIGFCQFHPSYDYTDFVEGLRPTKNNGFERRDGVFKEFCANAVENLNIYNNSLEEKNSNSVDVHELFSQFANSIEKKLMESDTKMLPFSNSMKIKGVSRFNNGEVRSIEIVYCLPATWTKTAKLIRCIINERGTPKWQKDDGLRQKKKREWCLKSYRTVKRFQRWQKKTMSIRIS